MSNKSVQTPRINEYWQRFSGFNALTLWAWHDEVVHVILDGPMEYHQVSLEEEPVTPLGILLSNFSR